MQLNELFNGPSYTDYNIALQKDALASTQPLPQTLTTMVDAALEPAALHEVLHSDDALSPPPHSEVAQLHLTFGTEELNIRTI